MVETDSIQAILAGRYRDTDTGEAVAVPTRSVLIADTLAGREQELVAGLGFGESLLLVCDPNTFEALGYRVAAALSPRFRLVTLVLPTPLEADARRSEQVRAACEPLDAVIAVGSGTVNDVCKYGAHLAGKPYAVFGTAPSMNGYTSVSASITVNGFKSSLPATAARGVFLDLGVLAKAPPALIRSGLGDSLCRCTAQADWLLAHLLRGQPYRELPFTLLTADEEALLSEPEALLRGDRPAIARLARTLVLSGFGMTLCGSSHPASQGEHLISHYIEMMSAPDWPKHLHGEQIGVTTLTMAELQHRLMDGPPPCVAPTRAQQQDLVAHFGEALGTACWREFSRKLLDKQAAEDLNAELAQRWDAIRERIRPVLRPVEQLRRVLRRAGAPDTPEALHLPRAFYRAAVRHAREIRNRYTFLDLAGDSGLLQD
jgi:glycerol-1-phosphate dehydrogenase [NAD(P)+]